MTGVRCPDSEPSGSNLSLLRCYRSCLLSCEVYHFLTISISVVPMQDLFPSHRDCSTGPWTASPLAFPPIPDPRHTPTEKTQAALTAPWPSTEALCGPHCQKVRDKLLRVSSQPSLPFFQLLLSVHPRLPNVLERGLCTHSPLCLSSCQGFPH